VFASVENRDLGGASADIEKILADVQKHAPRGTIIAVTRTTTHSRGICFV